MQNLGLKSQLIGAGNLKKIDIEGNPTSMPYLKEGAKVFCGFYQGDDEEIYVCESLEDMQNLYNSYVKGFATKQPIWYIGGGDLFEAFNIVPDPDVTD